MDRRQGTTHCRKAIRKGCSAALCYAKSWSQLAVWTIQGSVSGVIREGNPMIARTVIFASIGVCLVGGSAQALDQADLAALQASVREMCVQPDRKGSFFTVEGDLDAGATLRVVGVKAGGKITKEDWDGISQRLDQYKTDPRQCAISIVGLLAPLLNTPKACRDPSHGVDHFGREFDVTRESPEMGGGHNRGEWCNSAIGTLRGEFPGGEFTVRSDGEHTNNHCAPANCPQYVYSCTIHVKADPIYVEKVSSACH